MALTSAQVAEAIADRRACRHSGCGAATTRWTVARAACPLSSPRTSARSRRSASSRSSFPAAGQVTATRRLDGGRREVLAVSAPAVVSVEGATAELRRAGLGALRAAAQAPIDVRQPSSAAHAEDAVISPYRPRARALAAPRGAHPLDRLRALTDAGSAAPAHGESVVLEPAAAAARIVAALRTVGLPRMTCSP